MITANVAAAETLNRRKRPCLFRVHDAPTKEDLDALSRSLDGFGLRFTKARVVKPQHFNRVLEGAANTDLSYVVSDLVLRSQTKAEYAPANIGHFGLGLRRYAHFTSPIRRYADLIVHRSLIGSLKLGEGGLAADPGDLGELGAHLLMTERRGRDGRARRRRPILRRLPCRQGRSQIHGADQRRDPFWSFRQPRRHRRRRPRAHALPCR